MTFTVGASNVPAGRFPKVTATSEVQPEPAARWIARNLSKTHRGVAFTVYRADGDGATAVATFLNGALRFNAA